jgi:hypothetical protein
LKTLVRDHLLPHLRHWLGRGLQDELKPADRAHQSSEEFAGRPLAATKKTADGAKTISVRSTKMNFILNGFTEETGFRVFAFQGIGANGTRLDYTVRADLGLIRTYGIRLQDLPLLCRGMLDRLPEGTEACAVTFTEEGMRLVADTRAAERDAARQRKPPRRPPTEQHAATGWRAGQP